MWNTERVYQFNWILTQTHNELQALETCTCALYLSAIMIFYDAKELSNEHF